MKDQSQSEAVRQRSLDAAEMQGGIVKLLCINVWRKCNCGRGADYMNRIPDDLCVEKINASVTYLPAARYKVRVFPTWLVVDDNDGIVARSTELDFNIIKQWYEEVKQSARSTDI